MKLFDWLTILGVVLLLLVGFFLINYYLSMQQKECMHNPFIYGAKQLKDTTGEEVHGTITFLTPKKAPTITFNSENMSVLE